MYILHTIIFYKNHIEILLIFIFVNDSLIPFYKSHFLPYFFYLIHCRTYNIQPSVYLENCKFNTDFICVLYNLKIVSLFWPKSFPIFLLLLLGVHQKALETYDIIFKCMGTNRLATELFIYSAGLFPLLCNAALNVRSILLSIYETHFVPLGQRLRPALNGFLSGYYIHYVQICIFPTKDLSKIKDKFL